uniref:Retinal cone rhodopsin-sensitive cGMP 3',5'-cyclic phosphodiesterase subunit gamma n=1 Tax=Cyprinus carpio TaxID=7962 RepID=A0A8C1NP56_CYPCA
MLIMRFDAGRCGGALVGNGPVVCSVGRDDAGHVHHVLTGQGSTDMNTAPPAGSALATPASTAGPTTPKKGPPKFKQRQTRTFKSKAPKPGQKGYKHTHTHSHSQTHTHTHPNAAVTEFPSCLQVWR